MSYEVVFLKEAQKDLNEAHEYLLRLAPSGAASWLDALEAAIDALEGHPERCARAPEDNLVDAPIQNLSFRTRKGRPYRLVYTIVDHEVRVFRLLGPGHDLLRTDDFS